MKELIRRMMGRPKATWLTHESMEDAAANIVTGYRANGGTRNSISKFK